MEEFVLRALLGGVIIAIIAGPIGCFVVWRQLSYFGATIAHAALLGVAIGLLAGQSPVLGIIMVSLLVAMTLFLFEKYPALSSDTVLGILAHGLLAIGLIIISQLETVTIDLMGYLFGDVLAISRGDLLWIAVAGIIVLGVTKWIWSDLLLVTTDRELAHVEGINVRRTELLFVVVLALTVSVAIQVIGVLLTVSMFIIPAASARQLSTDPESMAAAAVVLGGVSVSGGIASSLIWDFPAGPAIVSSGFLLFVVSMVAVPFLKKPAA